MDPEHLKIIEAMPVDPIKRPLNWRSSAGVTSPSTVPRTNLLRNGLLLGHHDPKKIAASRWQIFGPS